MLCGCRTGACPRPATRTLFINQISRQNNCLSGWRPQSPPGTHAVIFKKPYRDCIGATGRLPRHLSIGPHQCVVLRVVCDRGPSHNGTRRATDHIQRRFSALCRLPTPCEHVQRGHPGNAGGAAVTQARPKCGTRCPPGLLRAGCRRYVRRPSRCRANTWTAPTGWRQFTVTFYDTDGDRQRSILHTCSAQLAIISLAQAVALLTPYCGQSGMAIN